jgi:hypothetical protein
MSEIGVDVEDRSLPPVDEDVRLVDGAVGSEDAAAGDAERGHVDRCGVAGENAVDSFGFLFVIPLVMSRRYVFTRLPIDTSCVSPWRAE